MRMNTEAAGTAGLCDAAGSSHQGRLVAPSLGAAAQMKMSHLGSRPCSCCLRWQCLVRGTQQVKGADPVIY